MNSHNRRLHPRSETDHPANLHYQGTTLTGCRIRNYSKGGFYLERRSGGFHILAAPAKSAFDGQEIKQAELQIPWQKSGEAPFNAGVRICYFSETGVGLALLQQNSDLFQYFEEVSKERSNLVNISSRSAKGVAQPSRQTELIFQPIVRACQRFLNKQMPEFFTLCEERLPAEADAALVDTLKTDIFYAQSTLRDQRYTIIGLQLNQLNTKFTQLTEQKKSPGNGQSQTSLGLEMDLVNKDDFEEWVIIVGLGRSVEAEIPALLHMLEMGLGALVKRAINSDTNPVSPAYLLWSLSSSLVNLNIELPVRKILYSIFKDSVLSHIDELYTELGKIFERHGIDTHAVSIRSSATVKSQQPAVENKPARRESRSVMSALSSIVSSIWRGKERDDSPVQDRRSASSSEIISSLDSINRFSDRPIADLIEQSLAKKAGRYGAVKLNMESRENISTTEQLLLAMKQDNHLSRGLQNLIHGLETSIIKEVIENPRLLDDAGHPARRLLEGIDQLAPYSSSETIEEPLLQIIEELSNSPAEQSHDNLVEATHKIESLLHHKREVFDRNLSLVVESSRQMELLDKSRQIIERQLAQRLENRSVSIVVDRLLRLGWPGLLIQSKASKSGPGRKTKEYLGVLDALLELYEQDSELIPSTGERSKALIVLLQQVFRNIRSISPMRNS